MPKKYPYHAVMAAQLAKQQYQTCKETAEELIAQQEADSETDDFDLCHLQLFVARALLGLSDYHQAIERANLALFLAKKLKDSSLIQEARYRSGICYGKAGLYPIAVQRLTEALPDTAPLFRAKVLYNRGAMYEGQGAYAFAVPDYEEAIRITESEGDVLARICRIALAWNLVLLHRFDRAEEVLEVLATDPEYCSDPKLRLHVLHDRAHMAYLKGEHREALRQASAALQEARGAFPHVRAYLALTLMSVAAERSLYTDALSFGMFGKRLAGLAHRLDIDQQASWQMRKVEFQAGPESLIQALEDFRQLPGPGRRRRGLRDSG